MVIIIQAVSFTSKILNSVNFELGITVTTDTELCPWNPLKQMVSLSSAPWQSGGAVDWSPDIRVLPHLQSLSLAGQATLGDCSWVWKFTALVTWSWEEMCAQHKDRLRCFIPLALILIDVNLLVTSIRKS